MEPTTPSAQQAVMRHMGEIRTLLNNQILTGALQGDALRTLQRLGQLDQFNVYIGGNDIEARMLMSLVERLEKLIRDGMEFGQALEWLRNAGWADKVSRFAAQRMGG